jgi:hypothetical protein
MEAQYLRETGLRKGNIHVGHGNQRGGDPRFLCFTLVVLDGCTICNDLVYCLDKRNEVQELFPEVIDIGDLEEEESLGLLGKANAVVKDR